MDGVVVVDKPAGMTSHDVVDRVRKALDMRKVGHAGTLDPDATGVLIVGLGRATRFLSYAQAAPKRYLAEAAWGIETDTQDASGDIVAKFDAEVDPVQVEAAIALYIGDIEQIPPMVSAVKVDGERLYRKARRGEVIERAPRKAHIYSMQQTGFDPIEVVSSLDVTCSAGTYVRTLIHDIGRHLGCGGHMKSLRRTEAGGFGLADAVPLDQVSEDVVLPLRDVVRILPSIEVDAETASLVSHGRAIEVHAASTPVAVLSSGELLAVYRDGDGALVPDRVVGA